MVKGNSWRFENYFDGLSQVYPCFRSRDVVFGVYLHEAKMGYRQNNHEKTLGIGQKNQTTILAT